MINRKVGRCKKPRFSLLVSVFKHLQPDFPLSAKGKETASGYKVVLVLIFPFPLSDSYRKKCVYTCLDYSLLLGNGEVVVGEEWKTE